MLSPIFKLFILRCKVVEPNHRPQEKSVAFFKISSPSLFRITERPRSQQLLVRRIWLSRSCLPPDTSCSLPSCSSPLRTIATSQSFWSPLRTIATSHSSWSTLRTIATSHSSWSPLRTIATSHSSWSPLLRIRLPPHWWSPRRPYYWSPSGCDTCLQTYSSDRYCVLFRHPANALHCFPAGPLPSDRSCVHSSTVFLIASAYKRAPLLMRDRLRHHTSDRRCVARRNFITDRHCAPLHFLTSDRRCVLSPRHKIATALCVPDLLAHFVMTVEITLAGDGFYKQWCLCDQNC